MRLEVERGEFLNDGIGTPSAPDSHQDLLTAFQSYVIKEIDVKGVTNFVELGAVPCGPIKVSLDLNVGILAERPLPASQNIASGDVMRPIEYLSGGRRIDREGHPFSVEPLIHVTLQCERIASVQIPIRPKAQLARLPMVKLRAVGMELRTPDEAFAIHPVVEAPAVLASPAKFSDPLIDIPATQGREHSVSIFRAFGDDVYDSIDGVRAPDRSAGASNHLNSLDVFKQGVLDLPIHAGKER